MPGDRQVTVLDIQDTVTHWGETTASACYASPHDQNSDGWADVIDVQQVSGQSDQNAPLANEVR